MQSQRYWVERAIEDGKGHASLADYQVRSWRSWHHHLVLIAVLFKKQFASNMLSSLRTRIDGILTIYYIQSTIKIYLKIIGLNLFL